MTVSTKKGTRKDATPRPTALPVIRPRVAGLDVGSSQHWVCGPAREDGKPNVRVFGTTTDQLRELTDWLADQGVESVAMESTSVCWIPVYELLESRGIEVLLVNARQLPMSQGGRPTSATVSGCSCSIAAGCCVARSARARPSPGSERSTASWPISWPSARGVSSGCRRRWIK
jgi:hypothetical protein